VSESLRAETRGCPVCASTHAKHLFDQVFTPIEGVRLLDGYAVRVCSTCGCGYAGNIPPQSVFEEYYRTASKYENNATGGKESNSDRDVFRALANILQPHLGQPSVRILDIGCGTGGLLQELKTRGFCDVLGIDPSPQCAQYARQLYEIDVRVGTLSDLPADEGLFDVVILVGVLEHVRDVAPAVAAVKTITAPDGLVFVVVPDAAAFQRCITAPFQHFSTEHINFFSRPSLANLMRTSGLTERAAAALVRSHCLGNAEPLVAGIYGVDATVKGVMVPDSSTEPALREYINKCNSIEKHEMDFIASLPRSHSAVLVWGVGSQTQRLLGKKAFAGLNVKAFVDSDPRFHGKKLAGVPVIPPTQVREYREPILICSKLYSREIKDQIRGTLNLPNEVLTLYDDSRSG
jgi:SAM-dependent methyltransferase